MTHVTKGDTQSGHGLSKGTQRWWRGRQGSATPLPLSVLPRLALRPQRTGKQGERALGEANQKNGQRHASYGGCHSSGH